MMELSWKLDLFQPADAPGIVTLYREVYGDKYPVKAVYEPQEIIRQEELGECWRAVARTGGGEVVAMWPFIGHHRPTPVYMSMGS